MTSTDLFAGRLYGDFVRNNASRATMRRLLAKRRGQAQTSNREEALAPS